MKPKYQLILDTINMHRKNRGWGGLKDWEKFVVYVCEKELGLETSLDELNPKFAPRHSNEISRFDERLLIKFENKIAKFETGK